jgi:uncharacterized repeat protein (TIGR03803 family)
MKQHFLPFIPKSLSLIVIALAFTAGAWAQTETIAYSFTGGSDGGSPSGGLVLDTKGNLYGAAESGGANGAGAIFELTPNSGGGWTEQVLYSFNGFANQNDGYFPFGGLVFDKKGSLYGTTIGGGTSFQGMAFQLSPGSNGTWTETVIYNFSGGTSVGSPQAMSFVIDGTGNLYGFSVSGCAYGFGCVFELVAGSTWTLKILHSFTGGNDGYDPFCSSLVLDSAGNLYGSTTEGGLHDYGVVFKLTPQSDGTWSEKVLYSFNGLGGVASPTGKLTIDSEGKIYGTAYDAFELSPDSNGVYKEKVTSDSAGNLYGTTYTGGAHRGTVFELSPGSNGTWTEKVLHAFSATGGDGLYPYVFPLSIDGQGHLYGTTSTGGSSNSGVVYEVTP